MAAKTIIVPQGVINPDTLTVIEIPEESQHESVFVANVTQPQPPKGKKMISMCNSIELRNPADFQPRFESSPLANRPAREPTFATMDSSVFRDQMSGLDPFSAGTSDEGSIDVEQYFKPEGYVAPEANDMDDFMGLGGSMPLELSSKTSISRSSGSNASMGGGATRKMVTTTKLINLSPIVRPHDYYKPEKSPGWHKRYEPEVLSPNTSTCMRYCDAHSSPAHRSNDNDAGNSFFSTIRESDASVSGSESMSAMRSSMIRRINEGRAPVRMEERMLSPIEREGYYHNEHGMPIGPSPSKSYYKPARRGEHDRRVISSLTMDESSGMTTGNVSRGSRGSPHRSQQLNTTCNVTCPRAGNVTGGPRMLNVTGPAPARAAANVTQTRPKSPGGAGRLNVTGTICPGAQRGRPKSPVAGPSSRRTPSPRPKTPPAAVAYMQAVPANAAANNADARLNRTVDIPRRAPLNATFDRPNIGNAPMNWQQNVVCRDQGRTPANQRRASLNPNDNMHRALRAAEMQERQLIDRDLRRMQQQRRRMFQQIGRQDRDEHRRRLFGEQDRDEEDDERRPRCRRPPMPIEERPRFNRFA